MLYQQCQQDSGTAGSTAAASPALQEPKHPGAQPGHCSMPCGAGALLWLCRGRSRRALTVADHAPGHLPEHQPEGPDVHTLVGVEAVGLDALVQHLGGHVALGAHARVVAHVQLVCALGMHHGKA